MRPTAFALVAFGGALGAMARYAAAVAVARLVHGPFPVGTWTVNLIGCFLIGLIVPFVLTPQTEGWRLFAVVGVLGGFTTFSSFSQETFTLLRDGRVGLAVLNVAGSVALGLLLTALGWRIARALGAP